MRELSLKFVVTGLLHARISVSFPIRKRWRALLDLKIGPEIHVPEVNREEDHVEGPAVAQEEDHAVGRAIARDPVVGRVANPEGDRVLEIAGDAVGNLGSETGRGHVLEENTVVVDAGARIELDGH